MANRKNSNLAAGSAPRLNWRRFTTSITRNTEMARMQRCIVNGCKNPAKYRGLCRPCYCAAWRSIKAGETTWEKLEREKKVLPRNHARTTAFTRAVKGV